MGVALVYAGTANDTTIHSAGVEIIFGGTANHTTIDSGGLLHVYAGGAVSETTINNGGNEIVDGGTADDTTIHGGGAELVYAGTANHTTIDSGGLENVNGGTADGVTFGGPQAKLELANPSGLIGTISNWHVGDVIDFLNTSATSVHENAAHTTLTVTYGTNETASYSLAGQQADTEFKLQSDGHGGTDLILIGVASHHHPFV